MEAEVQSSCAFWLCVWNTVCWFRTLSGHLHTARSCYVCNIYFSDARDKRSAVLSSHFYILMWADIPAFLGKLLHFC